MSLNVSESAVLRVVRRGNLFSGTVDELASVAGIPVRRAWFAVVGLERLGLVKAGRSESGVILRPTRAGSVRGSRRRRVS
jgi:hypothetical protein